MDSLALTKEVVPHGQGELPIGLRLPSLILLTLVSVIGMGTTLTLSPGPLCDEGNQLLPASQRDTYYAHPNGSTGQMVLEAAAFAVLGMRLVPALHGRSWALQLTALAGWNAVHVALFYTWLAVTPHWTWMHTALLSSSLLAFSAMPVPSPAARAS